jgi:serine protease Do
MLRSESPLAAVVVSGNVVVHCSVARVKTNMLQLRPSIRVFLAVLAPASVLSFGAGCQQQAPVVVQQPSAGTGSATSAAPAAPPLATQAALPPAPVPATFDVAALAEQVKPMVVNITTMQSSQAADGDDPLEFFFGPRNPHGGSREAPRPRRVGLGTGFVIDPTGFVVTNEHVVHDAEAVQVKLADDREFKATIVGRDPELDLALLKLEGAKDLPSVHLGSSDGLRVGEHVLAVGNPFGLSHTVTLGIVSAKGRGIGAGRYDDFIQTDASINPGNSGGPLFNWRGEVVGINAAIRAGANGIGFAIPIDALKSVLPQLREKGHVDRGKLGLLYQPVSPDLATALGLDTSHGALVSDVEKNGPAARAGIQAGDVVTAVNGTTIVHAEELPRRVAMNAPGATVKVTYVRNHKAHDVDAKLDPLVTEDRSPPARAPRPDKPSDDKLGIAISDAPGGGVRVEGVASGSVIHDLEPGDVIIEMNGQKVADTAGLRAALTKAKAGTTAICKVKRGPRLVQFAAIPIPK